MYGNNISRSLNALKYFVKQPKYIPSWLYNNVTKKTPLITKLPWLSYSSIDFINNYIKNFHRVFEYGGGGSTLWFAERCKEIICTENSKYWGNMILDKYQKNKHDFIAALKLNIIEVSEQPKIEEYSQAESYVNTIVEGAPYDIILVDGIDGEDGQKNYRVECISKAKDYLNNEGIIILDDSWRNKYSAVPKILSDFARLEFWGLGPCRLGVTKTDIYIKRSTK